MKKNDLQVVKLCLQYDIDFEKQINKKYPLVYAVEMNRKNMVELFLINFYNI